MRSQSIAQAWATKAKQLQDLFKPYASQSGELISNPSAEDQTKITTLQTEIAALKAEYETAKAFEDNQADQKAFSTPVSRIRFPGAPARAPWEDPEDLRAKPRIYSGSLKYIDLHPTRQENEELAFKFFRWWVATAPYFAGTELQIKSLQFCQDNGIPTIKALNEGVNEQGGSLVPDEFDRMLIRLLERFGVFRANAQLNRMASDVKYVPRRIGGVTANWTGEGAAIAQSQPAYDNVLLVAKKLAALTVISSEITEDSAINIADQLSFEIALAFATSEDQAGFNGDASPTFGGITGVTTKLKGLDATIANIAGLQVATGTGYATNYASMTLDDFSNTAALLPQFADGPGAAWYVNRSFYFAIMQKLELAKGGVTAREVAIGDRSGRPLFLGYPVNFTQAMPRISAVSQIAALLGDLAMAAMFGDRRVRTLFTDPYSLSANDQIQVRGTERVDCVAHSLGNASATAALRVPGSIVGLITASS